MSQDGRRRSEEIEHEIYQARARLDETLHQIEERLSPEQLMNMTYDYLRHGGAERIASRLGRTIKENPLPVMVTGIGLGWLVLAQRNSHHDRYEALPRHAGYPGSTMPQTRIPNGGDMPGSHSTVSGAGTTTLGHDPAAMGATPQHGAGANDHGGGMTRKAQQMAQGIRDRAEHLGGQVKDRAQHMGGQVRERASHLGEQRQAAMHAASHRVQDVGSQTTHFVQEHPLVAGALGVAVGAVLGSLFSPTRVENRHLGEVRDRAVHRAEELGQEQLERAEEKIHETAERVKEEARSAQSSNSAYVENASSEERFAKAGAERTGSMESTSRGPESPRDEAAKKGGSNAPDDKPQGGGSSPSKGS
ncbi:DUF3618 domain-containing protein [Billgrantia tianxiuensis]|uniref:DUF3618 domain-containing protein n=1 Tax=Billgrantia tianxiuensis TaxID=2497861 RepID=A0A6I6SHF0_9GAMM|nr:MULTISPECIES: DUF3618 domain-containing protein [Halomonas]MCE8033211.1 DUF3618 domain-containing protein [Halomonas sp. MCCC 1A11057]QHC48962.1 DUF3618 domain-containing protein [Halomonas tianxiuensis]